MVNDRINIIGDLLGDSDDLLDDGDDLLGDGGPEALPSFDCGSSMQLLKVIMGDQVPFDSSSKKCVTNGPTDLHLTWVGARDTCVSKNYTGNLHGLRPWRRNKYEVWRHIMVKGIGEHMYSTNEQIRDPSLMTTRIQ